MIVRALTLAGGLAGGAGLSQYPEFSQQYLQRLAGTVDELQVHVAAFDATAQRAGLTREEALAQRSDNAFLNQRQVDAQNLIDRSERLTADLATLRAAGPIERLLYAPALTDTEIASAALEDFRPAVPLSLEGLVCALVGLFAGGTLVGGAIALVRLPFRRRGTA